MNGSIPKLFLLNLPQTEIYKVSDDKSVDLLIRNLRYGVPTSPPILYFVKSSFGLSKTFC